MTDNLEEFMLQEYQQMEDDDDAAEDAYIFMQQKKWLSLSNICDSETVQTRRSVLRLRAEGHMRLWIDYFSETPTYPDAIFRRRFRMRRDLFQRIMQSVTDHDSYFVQKMDCANRLGLTPHQKVVAALRFLSYGASADIWGEYLCIGETTVLQCVKKFSVAIVEIFGAEYSRSPTATDLQRLTVENSRRGFPGMIGSIDCMHWQWKNCPTAWHGQYTGHKHAPTIILEAVASYDTWIWHSFFGMPGSCNDLNVLHRSTVFQELLSGHTTPINYEINGHTYDMGYYLADGIYPPYATIVKSYKNPSTQKQKVFAQYQEAARKDVERAFGILQARFAYVRSPAKLWNRDALAIIMKACIIMHNMIVEDESRVGDWRLEYENSEPVPEILRSPAESFYEVMARDAKMRDREKHRQLRDDLEEHIWAIHSQH